VAMDADDGVAGLELRHLVVQRFDQGAELIGHAQPTVSGIFTWWRRRRRAAWQTWARNSGFGREPSSGENSTSSTYDLARFTLRPQAENSSCASAELNSR